MENNIELRVGGKTAPSLLKSSIVGHVKSGKTVQIDSIGVAANYNATKGLILAKGQLAMHGITLVMTPGFQVLKMENSVENDIKTAIRWIVKGTT
ncbi:MAG: stage V sporulation protein S [Dethiobacter sp.]|jgi:stage V sporulation protein SpoVS|nr:stage V sporulation protein S [Dethiobacter sp.]